MSNPAPYFLDVDGSGDLTIWRHDVDRPDCPQPVARECDVTADAWRLLLAGVAAGRALAEWDTWNPFHGSYRQAAQQLRDHERALAALRPERGAE